MSLKDILTLALMSLGVFFMLAGALGLLRLPDLYMRMSATTKSSTLGVAFMLLATAVYFWEIGVGIRALATITFLMLTAPIAAHMIARAAYIRGVKLWPGTVDELKGMYDVEQGILISKPPTRQEVVPAAPPAETTE